MPGNIGQLLSSGFAIILLHFECIVWMISAMAPSPLSLGLKIRYVVFLCDYM